MNVRAAIATIAAALVTCVACAPDSQPAQSLTSSSTPTPPSLSLSEEPETVLYEEPALLEGELTRASYSVVDGVPTTSLTVRDALGAGEAVEVEGQCTGGETVAFSLLTASEHDNGSTLLEGSFDCDQDPEQGVRYELHYEGATQLTLTAGPDVDAAWVVVRRA